MLDVRLREERDVVLLYGFGEALTPVEVWGCAGVAFHDGVDDWAEEFGWGDVFCCGSLDEDAEVDLGRVSR